MLEPPASWSGDILTVIPGATRDAPDTLLLARGKSLFRSLDGGATWQRLGFQPQSDDRSLFVGTLEEETDVFHRPVLYAGSGGLFQINVP